MSKNLKLIEKKINEKYIFDKYKALCEMIAEGELSIKFLATKECQDSMGSERAAAEKLRIEQALDIRKAEKSFLENL